jgi:hypothetical protein
MATETRRPRRKALVNHKERRELKDRGPGSARALGGLPFRKIFLTSFFGSGIKNQVTSDRSRWAVVGRAESWRLKAENYLF